MTKNTKQQSTLKGNTILIIIGLTFFSFFFTSLPGVLASYIPEEWLKGALANHIQVVTLDEGNLTLSVPKKFEKSEAFNILGRRSGICFYYAPTPADPEMEKILPPEQIKRAKKTAAIAEIIGMTPEKQEFKLEYGEYLEQYENDGSPYYVICQRFSKAHSLLPEQFEALYIRPFKPFTTPYKITWETLREF